MFPRASWTNLLASSPMVVKGLASSATAIQNEVTANFADGTTGNGVPGAGLLIFGQGAGTWRRVGPIADVADGTTGILTPSAALVIYNGATFDRLKSALAGDNTTGTGILGAAPMCWSQSAGKFYRVDGISSNTDGFAGITNTAMLAFGLNAFYNGATWDRGRTNSVAAITATTQPFAQMMANPGEWAISNNAGAGNQSTASKAAGAAGVRHVLRAFLVTALATVAGVTTVNIRDGATGAGTVIWTFLMDIPANTSVTVALSGLNIFGSAATAMTIEQAAGVANITAAVNASGYSTI